MYITPSRRFIDLIHFFVIEKYGGADGVLNEGNIESAVHSPEASFGGQDLYDTDLKKCCKKIKLNIMKRIRKLLIIHLLNIKRSIPGLKIWMRMLYVMSR